MKADLIKVFILVLTTGQEFSPHWAIAAQNVDYPLAKEVRNDARFVANQLIIQYKPRFNVASTRQLRIIPAQTARMQVLVSGLKRHDGKGDLALASLSSGGGTLKQMTRLIQQVQKDPDVEFAEPNWRLHHLAGRATPAFPNDKYYQNGDLWGMYGDMGEPANPYGSQAAEVWGNRAQPIDCSDVYIGIVDEGVMFSHPDLNASVWRNPFDPLDGIDNDGNGYVDDRNGWDFYHDDRTVYDSPADIHGTHVAGIIAAAGNNGKGIAGVCWKAKLIAAKFMDFDGGDTVNAIKAIDYITDLKARHKLNIVATNNSWGGGGYSKSMRDAIKRAQMENILFVAAAGNSANDNDAHPLFPASYGNSAIVAVAALTSVGRMAYFSNFGKTTVDIAAPGDGILSTVPGLTGEPAYAFDFGTSMAAPFVTGAIALYAHQHPGSKAAAIKKALLTGAEPTPGFVGSTTSGGRLDVPAMLMR
ncbi:MAG: S8 family peptidase [Methylovulum sp.]|nr:S8 family peptidase [Methylovulum sp.]